MFKIVRKIVLHANMYQYDILAPRLAESALPGQFVIVKHGEYGERVPLTITDYDREEGTVSIVFQRFYSCAAVSARRRYTRKLNI